MHFPVRRDKRMPRKRLPPRPKQDPEQLKRFIETAREVEVDENPEAFQRAFERVVKPPPRKTQRKVPR
jgi:hypothetical protein